MPEYQNDSNYIPYIEANMPALKCNTYQLVRGVENLDRP